MNLLVKRYAQQEATYSDACSLSLGTVVTNGPVAIIIFVLVARPLLFTSIPLTGFVALAVTELVFAGIIETFAYGGLARERLRQVVAIRWMAGVSRLSVMGIYLAFLPRTEENWYFCYLVATGLASGIAFLLARRFGRFRLRWAHASRRQLKAGLSFAVGGTAFMIQDNADKPLVLRLSTATAAGTYEAGYRLISGLLVPFRAVLQASYARFFRVGTKGAPFSARLLRHLLPPALAYSVAVGVFVTLAAPRLAGLFGKGFGDTTAVLRWLSLLPVCRVVSSFVGDAITGANMNALRARLIAAAAGVNVALNLVLIPRYSWRGAAAATLVSESLLAAVLVVVLVRAVRRADRRQAELPSGRTE